jgi:uncharacterized membrane protein YphA (DoxX/SURF4 family)
MAQMTPEETTPAVPIPTRMMLQALAATRIFFGLDWLSNAIAKVIGKANFDWGFITFNLVNRDTAGAILHQGVMTTWIAPLHWFYGGVVIPNYGFFQWFLTVAEFSIAIGLLFGILSRLAAVGGLLLLTPIWLMLLTANEYFWTYPLDVVPLVLLAVVPTGRYAGLDGKIADRLGVHRWPL